MILPFLVVIREPGGRGIVNSLVKESICIMNRGRILWLTEANGYEKVCCNVGYRGSKM